ncbi:VRR-NUC domain-containing protein [Pseudomonas sp. Pse1]|uniref:VRR-NUC domain-containing protein n=1 Tax=Pseudomonas sp. Pse1 TaxID=2926020 RepID=UPI0021186DAC|nr:VRR-NUC domain-containing protein [Pseudomonas sp. Pse1]
MSEPAKQRTASRAPGGKLRSVTKPTASGVVLPVTDPLDLWYLCEKASYAKLTPYKRAKDGHPMYQRTVSQLVRCDNEAFRYHFPYCGEVGFDMSKSPPQPIMSKREPHRPSSFPLSQYQQLRNRHFEKLASMRVETDLLSKTDLEHMLSPTPSTKDGALWVDGQKTPRGLLRIPDVLRLRAFGNPGKPQYSQGNLVSVIEMKFPGDRLAPAQQKAYQDIAGDYRKLRLLETKNCDSSDKQKWREWVRSSESEPVYKPVGQVLSLASRASALRHKLLVGNIDAEHAAARLRLQTQFVDPGMPVMTAAPDDRAIQAQNRRAVASIEMTLAAPFVAIGAAMASMAAAPSFATAEATALVANAGGHTIRFEPFIAAVKRVLAGGALGTGAAMPAFAQSNTAFVHSTLSAEEQETRARWADWNKLQQHQQTTVQNYVFWDDVPETSHE